LTQLLDSLGRWARLEMCDAIFQWVGTLGGDFVTEESHLGDGEDTFGWVD
jgi:hypothetical protein